MPKTPYSPEQLNEALDAIAKRGLEDEKNSYTLNLFDDLAASKGGLEFVKDILRNEYSLPDVAVGIEMGLYLAANTNTNENTE